LFFLPVQLRERNAILEKERVILFERIAGLEEIKERNAIVEQERTVLFERIAALEAQVRAFPSSTELPSSSVSEQVSSNAAPEASSVVPVLSFAPAVISPRAHRSNDMIKGVVKTSEGKANEAKGNEGEAKKSEGEEKSITSPSFSERKKQVSIEAHDSDEDAEKKRTKEDAEKRAPAKVTKLNLKPEPVVADDHSPRFEPLEDAPLTRESRRRPPPPPPTASPAATVSMSPPTATAMPEVSPEPVRGFFQKSLKNTFGRSSKRPEEEVTLSRGSNRAENTPVLSRGSSRAENTPVLSRAVSPRIAVVEAPTPEPSVKETIRVSSSMEMRCVITGVDIMSDGFKKVVLYNLIVTSRDGDEWRLARRYNQFLALHQSLQDKTSKSLAFPPKKFALTMDQSKMKQRQVLLQKFLDQILEMPTLTSTMEFMRFLDPLESPSVWSLSFQDVVLDSDEVVQVIAMSPFHQQLERQERCLMLVQAKLFVFRDEMGVDALHVVSLDYSVVDFEGQMETGLFGFSVRHLTQSQPLFFEADEAECRKWVAAIRQVRKKKKKRKKKFFFRFAFKRLGKRVLAV
jgi:hypothetical protein